MSGMCLKIGPTTAVSTIGAGDNFNAGIIYGLLKYNIGYHDLSTMSKETWEKIIRCGMDLASEVCQSYDNYISKEFATSYISQSKISLTREIKGYNDTCFSLSL